MSAGRVTLSGWSTNFSLNETDFADLETAAELAFNTPFRRELAEAFQAYFDHRNLSDQSASAPKVKKRLKEIETLAGKLAEALARNDPGREKEAAQTKIREAALISEHIYPNIARIRLDLGNLRRWADQAAQRLPVARPGPSDDRSRDGLIITVLDIFRRAGGRGNTSDAGIALVKNCFEIIGIPGTSGFERDAILKTIQRALDKIEE